MFIKMEIQDKEGNPKTIKVTSDHWFPLLLKFASKIRKYANPNWKILSIKTDDPKIASHLENMIQKENIPIEIELALNE